jgi:hypothetical protein
MHNSRRPRELANSGSADLVRQPFGTKTSRGGSTLKWNDGQDARSRGCSPGSTSRNIGFGLYAPSARKHLELPVEGLILFEARCRHKQDTPRSALSFSGNSFTAERFSARARQVVKRASRVRPAALVDKLAMPRSVPILLNRRGAAFSPPVGNDDGEVGIGNSLAEGQKRTVLFERRVVALGRTDASGSRNGARLEQTIRGERN